MIVAHLLTNLSRCIVDMAGPEIETFRFGNFHNYYAFNPPGNRIDLIPHTLLHDVDILSNKQRITALDIGCNRGVS